MASEPLSTEPTFDIREQAARIDQALANAAKMRVEAEKAREEAAKIRQEKRSAPVTLVFTGMGAASAFIAAGVAIAKLLGG
ncbi:hypothetical protein [Sphingomonas bacterium]|uniref:hypothetical protein n=1 Tax=Sphingomonas bacterium TaxID=1895847 RepID=UPI0015762C2A|nr:hypothetical protein [Sphingomonas bacterium]